MKTKHILSIHILIVVALVFLWLNGCATTNKYTNESNRTCLEASRQQLEYHRDIGNRVRMCYGFTLGETHMWVEYFDGNRWLVDDIALGYKGFPREAYGETYTLRVWVENGEVGTE